MYAILAVMVVVLPVAGACEDQLGGVESRKVNLISTTDLFIMNLHKYLIPAQNKNHIYADTPHRTYADIIQVQSFAAACPGSHR